ncbi:MAG: hypothetical protein RLZZ461_1624 [Planctomycetota bacterium]|jgi:hypothetical protein
MRTLVALAVIALVNARLVAQSEGAEITWAEIVRATVGAEGSATFEFNGEIAVEAHYAGEIRVADLNPSTNYFDPSFVETYTSDAVPNMPPDPSLFRIYGGGRTGGRIDFDSPVTNVVIAIVSLGANTTEVTMQFDQPCLLESSGPGAFGNGPFSLDSNDDSVLRGREGHGIVRFLGPLTSISWSTPVYEPWYGFRVGLSLTDCNNDGIVDYGQILDGTYGDEDGDGVPDCCEIACPGDLNGDDSVGPPDLGILLAVWGTDGGKISGADINGDGTVSAGDLGLLVGSWGECGGCD